MRSSLVVAGIMLSLVGAALYITLLGEAWLALTAGGLLILVTGFFLKELTERVEPPAGHLFCPFCSTPVLIGTERCGHCAGLQPPVPQPQKY